MITHDNQATWHELIHGISISTLVYGNATLMARFRLDAGVDLPMHRHPHEQTGYLVSGRMTMTIAGKAHEFGPGDSWCIPADVEHGAAVHETCLAIEVFSPVREDYLPYGPK